MPSDKAQEILNRVRLHLRKRKSVTPREETGVDTKTKKSPVNEDKTDSLFPNSADSGPEANLPITGPDQGMSSTRAR